MGNYAGLAINGTPFSGEQSGFAVDGIGDINGDGFDDIAVTAIRGNATLTYDGNATYYRDVGAVYVVFGSDAGFAPSLNLGDLDGTDGFKIAPDGGFTVGGFYGDGYIFDRGTGFGIDVAGAGDVNGDGIDDFIIGQGATRRNPDAYYGEGGSPYDANEQGVAYVIYGGTQAVDAVEAVGDLAGFRIDVEGFVTEVASAGDVNGDGFADVIVNATDLNFYGSSGFGYDVIYDADGNGQYDAGTDDTLYTGYFNYQTGKSSGFVIFGTDQARVSDAPIATPAPAGGGPGGPVFLSALAPGEASADVIVNTTTLDGGDGFEVVTGRTSTPTYGNYGSYGGYFGNYEGTSGGGALRAMGDFNGDGFDDLITNDVSYVGFYNSYTFIRDAAGNLTVLPEEPTGGGDATPGAAIINGQDTSVDPYPVSLDVSFTGADIDFRISRLAIFEADPGNDLGGTFGGIGDVFGDDGRDELAYFSALQVGADPALTTTALGVVVIDGTDQPPFSDNTFGNTNAKVREEIESDILGGQGAFFYDGSISNDNFVGLIDAAATGVGDINSDGLDDFLITGRGLTSNSEVGYLVFGAAAGFSGLVDLSALSASQAYKIVDPGETQTFNSFSSVAGAGDLNNDGHDDIIIGETGTENFTGSSYVIFGGTAALEALDNADGANDNELNINNLAVDVTTGDLPIVVSLRNAGQYTASQSEGDSGATTYTFEVTRTGNLSEIVSFDYAVAGFGFNPTDGADFVGGALPNGSVSFAAGEALVEIDVEIQGDLTIENSEEFSLEISNATTDGTSSISIAGDVSIARVFNDDQPTFVYVSGRSRNEDDDDPVGFTVFRYGDQSSEITGDFVISAGTADDADISGSFPLSGSFTIASGDFSTFIAVDQLADTDIEFSESLTIAISNVAAPGSLELNVQSTSATAYIFNDDFPPRITVSVDDSFVPEGDSGTTDVTFTITRSGDDLAGDVDVTFDINPFPAAGDFFALDSNDVVGPLPSLGNSVTIPDGQASVDFVVQVIGDGIIEPRESMILDVTGYTAPSGISYDILDDVRVTVFNDDGRPPVVPQGIEADVFGDPHIITLDGLGYDFQAVGEYVLVETDAGATNPFAVQVRFEPLPGSDLVSVTTRMAVEIDGVTVEVDALGDTPILIDGAPLTAEQLATGAADVNGDAADPGGAYDVFFNADQSEITIVLNDTGEQLVIKNMDGALNICVFLADAPGGNAGAISGLMGNGNGDLTDDYELRDGTAVPASEVTTDEDGTPSLSFDYLYGRGAFDGAGYAQSWELGAGERLFTNTASYPTGFPAASLKIDDLPADLREDAEAAAIAAGLDPADKAIFDAAVLDFALTGDADFLAGALGLAAEPEAQSTPTDAPALPSTVGVATGEPTGELTEGDTGTTSTLFTFYRIGDASGAVTVDFSVEGDVDIDDFQPGSVISGSITFEAGETTKTYSVDVLGDLETEGDEDIVVTIQGTSDPAVLIGASTATTKILTDDFAPEAVDDVTSGGENGDINGNVLAANPTDPDSDPDGDALTVTSFTDTDGTVYPANGAQVTLASGATMMMMANGNFTFSPSGDGTDTIYDTLGDGDQATVTVAYAISDGNGGSDTADLTITVNGANDAPIAVNDDITLDEDGSISFFPQDNDLDGEGDVLDVEAVGDPSNGTADLDVEGGLIYTPNPDFNGSDAFTYDISDGNGGTSTATVNVTVNPINDDPVITNGGAVSVDETTRFVTDVVSEDVDGPVVTYAISGGADASLFEIDDVSGALSFVDAPDFENPQDANGDNVYDVEVSADDTVGGVGSASFTVTVTDIDDTGNGAPVAVDDTYEVNENGIAIGNVVNGTVSDTDGNTTATGTGDSDPENDPLTVISAVDSDGNALSIDGLFNDLPQGGQTTLTPTGGFVFSPDEDFEDLGVGQSRAVTITYTISDGQGNSNSADITFNINGENDQPENRFDAFSVDFGVPLTINIAEDVLANDVDIDGDALSFVGFTPDELNSGTLIDNGDGTLTYTPGAGGAEDFFYYTVSDGNGGVSETEEPMIFDTGFPSQRQLDISIISQTEGDDGITEFVYGITRIGDEGSLQVTDTLTAQTDLVDPNFNPDNLPDATPDVDFIPVDTSVTFGPGETFKTVTVQVIGDTDVEPDEIFQLFFQWVPTPDAPDGNGNFDIFNVPQDATGTILNDDSPNQAPIVTNEEFESEFSEAISFTLADLLANDIDPDGDPLTITDFFPELIGGQLVEADGVFTYTPVEEFSGPAGSVFYTVSDGNGGETFGEATFFVDFPGDRTINASILSMEEGDAGVTEFVFGLTRFSIAGQDTDLNTTDTILIETGDADPAFNPDDLPAATAGVDYEALETSVTFAPGETFKSVTVNVFGDTELEPDEIFQLFFEHQGVYDNFTVPEDATATIEDDDEMVEPMAFDPSNYDNVFIGDETDNPIQGTPQTDWIEGREGRDDIDALASDDYIAAGSGNDWNVRGGSGADVFQFGLGDDDIVITDWQTGVDKIRLMDGLALSDLSIAEQTFGGVTRTTLSTALGDRLILINQNAADLGEADFVTGGAGEPPVDTPAGFDPEDYENVFTGDDEDNPIQGTPQTDFIVGGDGRDDINGLASSDYIAAGAGNDWNVRGGSGADVFQYGLGDDDIIVADWQAGVDKIRLMDDLALTDLSIVEQTFGGVTRTSLITDQGDRLILINQTADDLSEDDFVDGGDPVDPPMGFDPANYDNVFIGDGDDNPIAGTPQTDWIEGRGGRDDINGLGADDYIAAGAGNDWHVRGGTGADVFQFGFGDDDIVVSDWETGIDKVRLMDGLELTDLTIIEQTFGGVSRVTLSTDQGDRLILINETAAGINDTDTIA
jgi:hypothetical protein